MTSTTETNTQRTVLVTSAPFFSIGQAIALAFARLGYRVAVTSGHNGIFTHQTLKDMISIAPAGIKPDEHFLSLEMDLSNEQERDQLIVKVVNKFGRLDVLVNSLCIRDHYVGLMDEGFFEHFEQVMRVNLTLPARLAQLAAPHLLKSTSPGGGVIINISSVAAKIPFSSCAYAVSMAGVNMLTKQLANSFDGKNVRVLAVAHGAVWTHEYNGALGKATLVRRCGEPDNVAPVVVFLASEQASFMTGTTVDVDGGMACKAGLSLTSVM